MRSLVCDDGWALRMLAQGGFEFFLHGPRDVGVTTSAVAADLGDAKHGAWGAIIRLRDILLGNGWPSIAQGLDKVFDTGLLFDLLGAPLDTASRLRTH